MLKLKYKFHPIFLLIGCFLAVFIVQASLLPTTQAATITCPDGFKIEGAPSNERFELCRDHQIGDASPDATCYNFNGSTRVTCDANLGPKLDNTKCYVEQRGGPNGTLTGYAETSCKDATDRDQDGTAGGVGYCNQHPEDKENCSPYSSDNLVCADNNDGYCNFVKDYVNPGIQFLAVTVGIIVTIMIIIGGIQYSAAGGDPNAVAKAKNRIFNAIGALVAFGLLYAFLQYVIPGGVL